MKNLVEGERLKVGGLAQTAGYREMTKESIPATAFEVPAWPKKQAMTMELRNSP